MVEYQLLFLDRVLQQHECETGYEEDYVLTVAKWIFQWMPEKALMYATPTKIFLE